MSLSVENFSDLIRMARAEKEPPQLLTVLVKAELVHQKDGDGHERPLAGEGVLKPIMVKSYRVTDKLSFEQIKAEADALDNDWAFMMLAILPEYGFGSSGAGRADDHLKNMASALLTGGDLSRYLFVDRDGELVQVTAA